MTDRLLDHITECGHPGNGNIPFGIIQNHQVTLDRQDRDWEILRSPQLPSHVFITFLRGVESTQLLSAFEVPRETPVLRRVPSSESAAG